MSTLDVCCSLARISGVRYRGEPQLVMVWSSQLLRPEVGQLKTEVAVYVFDQDVGWFDVPMYQLMAYGRGYSLMLEQCVQTAPLFSASPNPVSVLYRQEDSIRDLIRRGSQYLAKLSNGLYFPTDSLVNKVGMSGALN